MRNSLSACHGKPMTFWHLWILISGGCYQLPIERRQFVLLWIFIFASSTVLDAWHANTGMDTQTFILDQKCFHLLRKLLCSASHGKPVLFWAPWMLTLGSIGNSVLKGVKCHQSKNIWRVNCQQYRPQGKISGKNIHVQEENHIIHLNPRKEDEAGQQHFAPSISKTNLRREDWGLRTNSFEPKFSIYENEQW